VSPLSNEETDKGNNPQTIAKKENADNQLLLGWIQYVYAIKGAFNWGKLYRVSVVFLF